MNITIVNRERPIFYFILFFISKMPNLYVHSTRQELADWSLNYTKSTSCMFASIPFISMPSSMSFEFEGEGRDSCNAIRATTTPAYKIW